MSEDTTTTDAPAQDTGATDQAQPEQSADQAPAEQQQDTPASTNQETQGEVKQESNPEEVRAWAEKKGLKVDLDNPDVLKMAEMQRAAEQKMHQTTAKASELKNAVNQEVNAALAEVPVDDQSAYLQAQVEALQIQQTLNDFYERKPEARELDAEMAKIVTENPNVVAGGLDALYALAKVQQLESGGQEALKSEGKREALTQLAQNQRAASPTSNATTHETSSSITPDMIRERTAAGDVEWLTKHEKEIDALYQ